MEYTPRSGDECAGPVLLQNDNFHIRFVVTRENEPAAVLIKREKGEDAVLARKPVPAGKLCLKITAAGQPFGFHAACEYENRLPVAEGVDGRLLSTPVAGGFIGTCVGMYASSNGKPSENCADWDWFEYCGEDSPRTPSGGE